MTVTLDQLLTLAGRLDDTPGFDAPRERFRRFLRDHVASLEALTTLISEAQHVPGEQHRRALQDLVAAVGRFIGFDVTFGGPVIAAGGAIEAAHQGLWVAPGLAIVLGVRSASTAEDAVAVLARAAAGVSPPSVFGVAQPIGLAVVTPQSPPRQKMEHALAETKPAERITVIGLETLLTLAKMVAVDELRSADAVRLFQAGAPIDLVLDLVGRAAGARSVTSVTQAPAAAAEVDTRDSHWLAGVVPDPTMSVEAFLELVVFRRQIFGIGDTSPATGPMRPGDALCFYVGGKGVVGHARVMSIMEDGSGIRDARRFRQILRLVDITLHVGRPVALDPESELRIRALGPASRRQQVLLNLSYERFVAMTVPAERHDGNGGGSDAPPAEPAAAS